MLIIIFLVCFCSLSAMEPFTSNQIEQLKKDKIMLQNRLDHAKDPDTQEAIMQQLRNIEQVLKRTQYTPPPIPTDPPPDDEQERDALLATTTKPFSMPTFSLPPSKKMKSRRKRTVHMPSRGPGLPHHQSSVDVGCLSWLFCCCQ